MTEAEDQQKVFLQAEAIVQDWCDKGIPAEEHAQQIAISLVLEQRKAEEWQLNYEALLTKYQALQQAHKNITMVLDNR